MSLCDKASAFADGMLEAPEADAFRMHLADCAECQDAVETALVLSVMDEDAGIGALSAAVDRRIPWWRRWFVWFALPAAAAAALALYIGLRVPSPDAPDTAAIAQRFQAALAPTRAVEPRFSYPGADRHRPYDVPLGDGENGRGADSMRTFAETIPAEVIAALEASEQGSGLVAAYALIGATERAALILDSLTETADALSDRAALAIIDKRYWDAVRFATEATEKDSRHLPASWNRAVALSRLALPLAAAAALDVIATSNEPGWADEAREKAVRLRTAYTTEKERWDRATQAVERLIAEHELPSKELVRSFPGMMRVGLYSAICTSGAATELRALVPLAETLDDQFGGKTLAGRVERLAASNLRSRAQLARRCAQAVASRKSEPELVRDAVRAGQPDIALQGLFWLPRLDDSQREIYLRLARDSGDSWLELLARERVLREQVMRGRGLSGVNDAVAALERCAKARLDFRCLRLEFWIASAFSRGGQADEALRYANAGWARARRIGDWVMELRFLWLFENLAAHNSDLGVMRAYLEETVERWPGCATKNHASKDIANALARLGRLRQVRQVLAKLDADCPQLKPNLFRLELDARLVRGDRQRAERVLAALAAHQDGSQAYAAYVAGRALATVDPDRATKRLREAIALASSEAGAYDAELARGLSYALGAVIAGRNGDFGAAIDVLAEDVGIVSSACSVGITHDVDVVVAVRDGSGESVGAIIDQNPFELLRRGHGVVPDELVDHLEGCSMIDVFAQPPFLGQPILPPRLAWRFREARSQPSEARLPKRRLAVSDTEPPRSLGLPELGAAPASNADVQLRGRAATPTRVLEELRTATVVEIHTHGVIGAEGFGNAALILSPDANGEIMLAADEIAKTRMRGAPLVLLSACHGAVTPTSAGHSLAAAFLEAGASSVVASPDPLSDRDAYSFFSAIRQRVSAGKPVAQAVRDERLATETRDHWSKQVVVFE